MKTLLFSQTVEHRFIHALGAPPEPRNAVAQVRAYEVARAEIPDVPDLVAAVWKVPAGAELAVPDACAAKLIALGYAAPVED